MAHVRYLADDALEGREVASPGARCAAEYIAAYFAGIGLEGAGPDGSFFQTFDIRLGSILGAENSLTLNGTVPVLETDWMPYGFSSSGRVTAPLIYGGMGVNRPGTEEDTYARLDISGKIVVVEGGAPQGHQSNTMTSSHFKATLAAGRDAATLSEQAARLRPQVVSVADPKAAAALDLPPGTDIYRP